MDIAIVTDSTSDIPPELAKLHNIHIIPAILVVNGQQLKDGEGISRQEFYEQLPTWKTQPSTAAPASGTFEQIYSSLLKQGMRYIISIHVSSLLSGMFNVAKIAAQNFGNRVHIVDSEQVTLGMGFQVLTAAEAVEAGMSLESIFELIQDVRRRIHLVAMLDTLEYLHRSGRVSWARASLGSFLQIKPFVSIKDGIVLRMGEARTRRKGIERLYEFLQNLGPLERLAILHTNAQADAHQMVEQFVQQVTTLPITVNVTSIIGTHVGPNGLGFVAVVR